MCGSEYMIMLAFLSENKVQKKCIGTYPFVYVQPYKGNNIFKLLVDSSLCLSEYRPRTLKVSTCPGERLGYASCGRCYCDLANYTLSSPSSTGTYSPTIDPVEMPDIFFPSLPFSCGYPCVMVMDNMKYREICWNCFWKDFSP